MSTAADVSDDQGPRDDARHGRRYFLLRRLHSITGVVPVGAFVVTHMWTNTRALYGRASFDHAVAEIQQLPFLGYIELFGIVLPILFHGLYGMVIAAQGRSNVSSYGHVRNWMYLLQRITGVLALGFILVHLAQYRVPKLLGRMPWENFYPALERDLNRPGIFALYVLGVTSTIFHFANGLWLFGNTWGITVSERAMKRSSWFCAAFGLLLWAMSVNVLLHFAYRCGGVVPLPEQHVELLCGGR